MQQPDYITQGMNDAATRHGGAMSGSEILKQYREIQARPIGEVKPYVAPDEKKEPDTGALTPSQKRGMKLFAGTAGTVSLCVAFIQQAATGVFNQYFGWAILAAAGVFVVSGVAGAVGSNSSGNSSSWSGGGKKEYHEHHHYHQQNNFGGNANQNNQR